MKSSLGFEGIGIHITSSASAGYRSDLTFASFQILVGVRFYSASSILVLFSTTRIFKFSFIILVIRKYSDVGYLDIA
jgi:hypothetical protein